MPVRLLGQLCSCRWTSALQERCSITDTTNLTPLSVEGCGLQGPLLELGPRLASYLKPNGVILLSGILVEQWAAVKDVYEPFFAEFEVASEGKWALVTGVRSDS